MTPSPTYMTGESLMPRFGRLHGESLLPRR